MQKRVQYNSGEYIGADEDGSLYKGVVVLMVQGLQKSSVGETRARRYAGKLLQPL